MADLSGSGAGLGQVDLTAVTDPDVRRAMRAVFQYTQQLQAKIQQQQQEIEALLQMMMEKHVGSIGEFKRHLLKLQQGGARTERIHGQIESAATPATPAAPAAPPAAAATPPRPATPRPPTPTYAEPEIDRPKRYTL